MPSAAQKPEAAFVLHRGNPNDPPRAGPARRHRLAEGGVSADFGLAADAPDADRRKRLAEWITDRHNPLFARVIVNRLWHYHFGVGLVETPNDFGFNGGRPSHPELLDWLAGELVGQRLEPQARAPADRHLGDLSPVVAAIAPTAAKVDAGNRLLWRKSPQRLEAETVRDAMLQLAGELDRHAGRARLPRVHHVRPQLAVLRHARRRSGRRSSAGRSIAPGSARPQPLLDVFDCPDPSTRRRNGPSRPRRCKRCRC